ncbi:class I SAM-dependent methyltransferase [Sporosarcina sp. Te-1]|uniref:class I SAM-dependent methyltransferase n=1 Tax=Sporosarcina sp. Te-1 TaxID=2818390 RepID=UPI001A9CD72D|nr:class I SAM-dependent methyltransferase [Sporosarcina sp. Te-1]QTD39589.1 class I SAM-dependent methyltransferase [Sporosarcina sp. Te-1]
MKLLNRLIDQAKNPRGFIGSTMLRIMNQAHSGMNKWAIDKIAMNEGSVMLDIGTGGGRLIHTLSRLNKTGKLYGIDYSAQAVQDSIRANKEDVESGKVTIRQASVSAIPFSENQFDFITAVQTHYFWPDIPNDCKEVFRVLKPDGQFMLVAEVYKMNYHMNSYNTKEEMERLFSSIGFQSLSFYENKTKGWLCMVGCK